MAIIPKVTIGRVGVREGYTYLSGSWQFVDAASGEVMDSGSKRVAVRGSGRDVLLECYAAFMQAVREDLDRIKALYSDASYAGVKDLCGWSWEPAGGGAWTFSHPALCPDGFDTESVVVKSGVPTLKSLVAALDEAPPPPEPEPPEEVV